MPREQTPAQRTWRVVDVHGEVHDVTASWLFKDNGGLVFRLREKDGEPSEEIAMFAPGQWTSCIRQPAPEK